MYDNVTFGKLFSCDTVTFSYELTKGTNEGPSFFFLYSAYG